MNFDDVKTLITQSIPDAVVEIKDLTGTADHLGIMVASDQFEGKMLIEQHQMIMDILKESLKEKIHAVQLKTLSHTKYKEMTA